MDTQKAVGILIQAVQAANLKGAFALADSKLIAEAVDIFTKPPKKEEPKQVTKTETKK